jgi:hypothetical protein
MIEEGMEEGRSEWGIVTLLRCFVVEVLLQVVVLVMVGIAVVEVAVVVVVVLITFVEGDRVVVVVEIVFGKVV